MHTLLLGWRSKRHREKNESQEPAGVLNIYGRIPEIIYYLTNFSSASEQKIRIWKASKRLPLAKWVFKWKFYKTCSVLLLLWHRSKTQRKTNLRNRLEFWIFMGEYLKSLSICKSSSSLLERSWNKTTTMSHSCTTS